jgi:hypothetical protein
MDQPRLVRTLSTIGKLPEPSRIEEPLLRLPLVLVRAARRLPIRLEPPDAAELAVPSKGFNRLDLALPSSRVTKRNTSQHLIQYSMRQYFPAIALEV